jgi:hypothetical protein
MICNDSSFLAFRSHFRGGLIIWQVLMGTVSLIIVLSSSKLCSLSFSS